MFKQKVAIKQSSLRSPPVSRSAFVYSNFIFGLDILNLFPSKASFIKRANFMDSVYIKCVSWLKSLLQNNMSSLFVV